VGLGPTASDGRGRRPARSTATATPLQFALVLAAYFVTAKLGLSLDALGGVAATVWAPSGIALAAVLIAGPSLWPAIALGAFSANYTSDVPAAACAGIMVGNTLAPLAGAYLMRRFGRFRDTRLDTVRDMLALVVLAASAASTLSATLGVTSVWAAGVVPGSRFTEVWWNWWIGDALGVLLVTPLIFGLRPLRKETWPRIRVLEAASALALLGVVGGLTFGADPSGHMVPHAYIVFPPLLWAALRFGQPGAAAATFALAAMAVLGTAEGLGPFHRETRADSLLALQMFMGSVALTVLMLGAVATERAREIVDRKQLESQLVIADRLAAVGTLAAGIGHEINNPLAFVIMSLDAAQEVAERQLEQRAEGAAELRELLGTVQEGTERIRRIVGDLKTLARNEDESRGPVDVHRVLDTCAQIAGNQIRHRARLLKEYGDVPLVAANEGRLAQVFLNLLINAAESIPEGRAEDNVIRLVTREDPPSDVVIEISDSGAGIEPRHLGRLFEPFFTTKPVGSGMGLGLSVCHGIVTAMGGSIAVESRLGAGTTFRVRLRAEAAPPETPGAPREPARSGPPLRILIVEDELHLARSLARLLSGHALTVAQTGREAVQLCAERDFDLILCDLLMPEVTGMDVHREIRRMRPGAERRIVFMTGGAFTARAKGFLASVPNRILQKPFAPDELLGIVAEWPREPDGERG
jgi:signal transduction histidine kinase